MGTQEVDEGRGSYLRQGYAALEGGQTRIYDDLNFGAGGEGETGREGGGRGRGREATGGWVRRRTRRNVCLRRGINWIARSIDGEREGSTFACYHGNIRVFYFFFYLSSFLDIKCDQESVGFCS